MKLKWWWILSVFHVKKIINEYIRIGQKIFLKWGSVFTEWMCEKKKKEMTKDMQWHDKNFVFMAAFLLWLRKKIIVMLQRYILHEDNMFSSLTLVQLSPLF